MENRVLKESFIPKFSLIRDNSLIWINSYSPYTLTKNIELQVTNGLGYEQIRESGKRIRSTSGLREHLGNVKEEIILNRAEIYQNATCGLVAYLNYLEKNIGKLGKKECITMSKKLDFIKNGIIEKDAYIRELEEKLEKYESKPNKKKKGILKRILN